MAYFDLSKLYLATS